MCMWTGKRSCLSIEPDKDNVMTAGRGIATFMGHVAEMEPATEVLGQGRMENVVEVR